MAIIAGQALIDGIWNRPHLESLVDTDLDYEITADAFLINQESKNSRIPPMSTAQEGMS